VSSFAKQHAVFSYYVLVFAISWGAILTVVGPSGFVSTTATSPAFALVGLASLLGPSLAGLMMTGLVNGRAGFRELLSRLLRWQVGGRWYAVALLTAPLVTLAILVTLSFASTAFLPSILTADDKASLLLSGVATGLIVAVFEELGWTGFATPRLRQRHGILATGLIMGLLWGTWHFPLFAGSTGSSGELPPVLFLAAMLFSWLVPYRVLMVWVYDRTESVLLAMVMHVPIVLSQYVLTPEAISGKSMFISLVAYTAALWLVVGAVALRNRRRHELNELC
jgi:membrane protease YdiL (CAAX protease family)